MDGGEKEGGASTPNEVNGPLVREKDKKSA